MQPDVIAAMRDEMLALRTNNVPSDYSTKDATRQEGEHKMHDGDWSWHTYISKGQRRREFTYYCPTTSTMLDQLVGADLMLDTPFSFCFFSTLHAQASIAPHTAPCNLRLRFHLPLVVPKLRIDADADDESGGMGTPQCGMRIAGSQVEWEEGKALVFDDSYEHEVWNRTDEDRVVLLWDVWHPDLDMDERRSIVDMFSAAREKGWLKQ